MIDQCLLPFNEHISYILPDAQYYYMVVDDVVDVIKSKPLMSPAALIFVDLSIS